MSKVILSGIGKTFDCNYFIENDENLLMRISNSDMCSVVSAISANNGCFEYGNNFCSGYYAIQFIRNERKAILVQMGKTV